MSTERIYVLSASELEALINFCVWFKSELSNCEEYEFVCDLDLVTVGDIGVALRTCGRHEFSDLRLDHFIDAKFPGSVNKIQLEAFAKTIAASTIAKYKQSTKEPQ